jgi:hypothetical protein
MKAGLTDAVNGYYAGRRAKLRAWQLAEAEAARGDSQGLTGCFACKAEFPEGPHECPAETPAPMTEAEEAEFWNAPLRGLDHAAIAAGVQASEDARHDREWIRREMAL